MVEVVSYEDFGARGDGQSDDLTAIAKAHAYANRHGLRVKADDRATYYIGGQDESVIIQTDTDFGAAKFVIDDTGVENRKTHVFTVRSALQVVRPAHIPSLKQNQRRLALQLPRDCVMVVTDSGVKRFIRRGANQDHGDSQQDVFIVRQNGLVQANTDPVGL